MKRILAAAGLAALLLAAAAHLPDGSFANQPPSPMPLAARVDALRQSYQRPGEIPYPDANPFTPEKALLGRILFFDPRLSGSNLLSCASCHNPSFG